MKKSKLKHPKNFNLIFEDALNFNFSTLTNKKIILVANLPYNIATTLIINWIKNYENFKSLVLMVQKEVAQRLYAKTGTKFYGRTSVLTQANASVKEKLRSMQIIFFQSPRLHLRLLK